VPQTGIDATTSFGFGGGYTDPTGLIYLVHRYFDSATGQFMSVDPFLRETQVPYEYSSDDPINGIDPGGLWGVSCCNMKLTFSIQQVYWFINKNGLNWFFGHGGVASTTALSLACLLIGIADVIAGTVCGALAIMIPGLIAWFGPTAVKRNGGVAFKFSWPPNPIFNGAIYARTWS